MKFGDVIPWENHPKYLKFNEIQNPLLVLEEFFSDDVPTHLEGLKKWKKYTLSEKVFRSRSDGPGELVFTWSWNIRLLEACYLLLYSYNDSYGRRNRVTEAILEKGRQQWIFFPDNLSEAELLNPYKRLRKLFKKTSLNSYRENLWEWLLFALYNMPIDEGELSLSISAVYENMIKLYSAAWIINQVEGASPLLNEAYRKEQTALAVLSSDKNETVSSTAMFAGFQNNDEVKGPLDGILDSKLTAGQRAEVGELTNLIISRFPSVKMVALIGKTYQPFTFNLLVLIDDKEHLVMDDVATQIEAACVEYSSILVIAEKIKDVRLKCEKANDFYAEVLKDKNVLYRSPDFVIYVKSGSPLSDRKSELKRDWQNRKKQTETLALEADAHFDRGNIGLTLVLLKQAVESALKSVIKILLDYEPQTSDLARLLRITLLNTDEIKDSWLLGDWEGPRVFDLLMKADDYSIGIDKLEKEQLTVKGIVAKVRRLIIQATQHAEQEVYEF